MANTVLGTHGSGIHSARPAGNAVPDGSLYSCSTHSLIYVSSYGGNSWATWASLSGTGFADPMTTRGDIIYRDASNVTNRLAIPAAGQVLGRSGSDLAAVYPPGYQMDYVQFTSSVTVTQTGSTDAATDLIVSGSSVAYDGSTTVLIEFFAPGGQTPASASNLLLYLYDGTTSLGIIAQTTAELATLRIPLNGSRELTPTNASHTYKIKGAVATGTGTVLAGAGGTGVVYLPGYIRITKAA